MSTLKIGDKININFNGEIDYIEKVGDDIKYRITNTKFESAYIFASNMKILKKDNPLLDTEMKHD